jgi:hypothetical protein
MDCQKFDQVVMDALYDELDELTYAALRRHVESCSRCAEILNGLRATREATVLPLEEPSEDLEARILAAVSVAQQTVPWHRKALRALAWAGSHAMRPQLAMAALFVLVIGSSLLLLRAKPGTVGAAPVRVTERGVPAPEEGAAESPPAAGAPAAVAATGAPAATAAPAPVDDADAKTAEKDGRGNGDAAKALADARAARDKSGCGAAVRLYDDVGARFPGSPQAADAMWEAAQCQKELGNTDKARELLLSLRSSEGYKARAEEALRESEAANNASQNAVASRVKATAGAPAGTPAAAAPAEAAATSNASAPGGGPGRNVVAAPKRSADKTAVDSGF